MTPVICPACQTENETGRKFCGECGAALPVLCTSCGSANPRTAKFCGECGASLVAAPIPAVTVGVGSAVARAPGTELSHPAPVEKEEEPSLPQEERRLVTALFCDLVGFTPLSERLDPEEVRDIQAEYFAGMRQQIERYGGTVEKYAGDAVLALFGAPITHEDDAERAVLCGLGMQAAIAPVADEARKRWNADPSIRVGVNTGEVVSGTWDTGGRRDVAVTGDAVNTAARIQSAAEPGEVVVGAETMRLTRRRIVYGERRDLVLKGKAGTIPGYPALRIREYVGERWEEGGRATPLVGRDRELVQLFDAWMRAQGGEGQLITLVGDPGVGKSRLVAELVEKVSSSSVRILRGRSLSYGQEISLWLIADLVRSLIGVREQDDLEAIKSRLSVALPGLMAGAEADSLNEATDVIGEVLGLHAGGSLVSHAGAQIRRQALVRSLRTILGILSERAPTILVLEDLHWIDAASQDVLRDILTDVPGLRMFVLVTHRPGWAAPWGNWGWPERLTLRPLKEDDAAVLAGAVLGGINLSHELEQYVAERAGGNPFFVEELLRALEETGGIEQHDGKMHLVADTARRLPSTLTEILLARLDRLESQVRTVAQVGSVIGRTFAVRLLAEVIGREQVTLEMPLTALQEAEIAFPRRGSDLEYVFKHVTMREVAYNTLVQKRRRELHLQTARAIATLYPSDEYAEMIAYHYSRTDENAEAIPWLEKAGDRAAAIYANDTAIGSYEEARRRQADVGGDGAALAGLDEKLAGALFTAGRYDESISLLEQVVEAYRRQRDLEGAARATALLGRAHRERGTPEEGIGRVEPMVELLAWSGPSQALCALHVALAHLYFLTGRYRDQEEASERAAAIARAIGDDRLLGEAEMRRGTALSQLGRGEEARQVQEQALPLVEGGGDLSTLFIALNNLAVASERLGRTDDMRRYMERALAVTERIGNPGLLTFCLGSFSEALMIAGEWREARRHLERGEALARTLASTADTTSPLSVLGRLNFVEGRWEEAARYFAEARAVAVEAGDRQLQEITDAYFGELEVRQGQPESAITRLEPLVEREDGELGFLLTPLILAHLAVGEEANMQKAEALSDMAVHRAQEQPGFRLHALWAQGMVFNRLERFAEAEDVLNAALTLARSMPYPYYEARCLVEMSHSRIGSGDQTHAREELESALAIFQRLGAAKDVETTSKLLIAVSCEPRNIRPA